MSSLGPADHRRWREAVLEAVRRYSRRHPTAVIHRRLLAEEELPAIVAVTGSIGQTPEQTLSRVLQELRNEGLLLFVDDAGTYLFVEEPVDVEAVDLPSKVLYEGLLAGRLRLGQVEARDEVARVRQRRGQDELRSIVLELYRSQCAVCDVSEEDLLVTSHIARWSDYPPGRGDLSNVVCLCRFHDALFELGYFTFSDDLRVVRSYNGRSSLVLAALDLIGEFRRPRMYSPSPMYLAMHRDRVQRYNRAV
jgi:hypothetical protein